MSKEQVVLQVLRDAGVYEKARKLVSSDAELARMFDSQFDELIQLASS